MINWEKTFKGLKYGNQTVSIKNFKENDYMFRIFENTATNRGVVTFIIGQDKTNQLWTKRFNKVKRIECL